MSYLVVNEHDTARINAHYAKCRACQIPYVLCKKRRTKADVVFDFVTFDHEYDKLFAECKDRIFGEMAKIYKQHEAKGSSCVLNPHLVEFRQLELHDAELAASEVYSIICDLVAEFRRD